MQEIIQRDHPDEGITDCILLTDTPMGDLCYVMSDWYMYGYLLKNGVWERWAEVAPLPQEQDTQLVFRRHAKGSAPGIQGACGLTYPDSLGFDILQVHKQQPGSFSKMMQFHWSGDDLSLVGWQPDDSDQFAIWQDGAWAFFNLATGKSLGSARIDVLREYGLLNDYQYLPHTLAVAQKMEAITQDSAKALFPEWTMAYCEAFSMGCMANAGYYRISDGFLTVRRIELGTNTGGIVEQTDSIPVPLSQTLLQRLQTEPRNLCDMSGYGNSFSRDFFAQN